MFINIKKHLHRNEKSYIFANVILNTIFLTLKKKLIPIEIDAALCEEGGIFFI